MIRYPLKSNRKVCCKTINISDMCIYLPWNIFSCQNPSSIKEVCIISHIAHFFFAFIWGFVLSFSYIFNCFKSKILLYLHIWKKIWLYEIYFNILEYKMLAFRVFFCKNVIRFVCSNTCIHLVILYTWFIKTTCMVLLCFTHFLFSSH